MHLMTYSLFNLYLHLATRKLCTRKWSVINVSTADQSYYYVLILGILDIITVTMQHTLLAIKLLWPELGNKELNPSAPFKFGYKEEGWSLMHQGSHSVCW